MNTVEQSFLGRGWRYCQWPGPNGLPLGWLTDKHTVAMADYEESVQQSVAIILGTAKGERVMRPDFGCGLHDLVFASNSPETSERAVREVEAALIRWEPRIDLLHVYAEFYKPPSGRDVLPNCLLIEVEYRVRTTNNRFNLVYPFYLE